MPAEGALCPPPAQLPVSVAAEVADHQEEVPGPGRAPSGSVGPWGGRAGRPQASGAAAQVLGRTDYHRFDNLGHCLIADHGWTDLADYSLNGRGRHPS